MSEQPPQQLAATPADLIAGIVGALRDQANIMIQVANDSPDLLGNPTAWVVVKIVTDTLSQLADRIEGSTDAVDQHPG